MQNFRNYYEILGVTKDASMEEIKKSYRRLARQYHPDLNPGDRDAEEQFKNIGEAYEILSDEAKRSQYDQLGRFWKQRGFTRNRAKAKATPNWNGDAAKDYDFSQYQDFNSFVDQLRHREGENGTEARVRSTAAKAYRPGTTKTAKVVTPRTGRRDVEARLTLPLEKAYRGGRERIRLEDGRSLEVDMPAGMVNGQRVRLKEQGLSGGDLYLKISIARHPFFQLQGTDIYCQVPITPSEAALGGAIEVPTIDGLVKMSVPKQVRSGQRLRLANKGYKSETGRGDQLVEIQIVTPPALSEEERELYEKLRRIETFNPRRDLVF
ncbi:MAG: DnaJ C-terminal domain-containing protein [Cyanophyceae cyanobacterium]